jgi:hypothetical protein
LRQRITATITDKALLTCTKQEQALYESRQSPLCAAPFKAYPLAAEFSLTDDETRFLVAHATSSNFKELPTVCSCGAPLDLSHSVSCGPNTLTRHNQLQSRFVAFAREQGCTVEQNPRLTVEDAEKQQEPDVVFYFGRGPALETDVTVVNPTAPSYLRRSAIPVGGGALLVAEKRKEAKYGDRARARGRDFCPLAFETHGRAGKDVLKLLGRLASLTEGGIGLSVSDMALDLAITLAKGNARCARTVAGRAMKAQDRARGAVVAIR